MNTNERTDKRPVWRGELALLIVILINSFGVVLMLDSGAGISAISSVPYAFSESFPALTLGTWTYIFQGILVAALMILRKKFVPTYLFSFVVGFAFSKMLDVYKTALAGLTMGIGYQIVYFIVSYLVICLGIALSNRCGLPIIPTDLFPREMAILQSQDHLRRDLPRRDCGTDFLFPRSYQRSWNRNDPRRVYDG
jgi:uncharacterized membrane protein YczE